MAITVHKLIDLILIITAAVVVLGLLSTIFFSLSGEAFSCRLSVTLAAYGLGDSLNCRILEVTIPEREFTREQADRFLAEQMLECHSIYQADRERTLKSHEWLRVSDIPTSVLTGSWPGGRLFDDTFGQDVIDRLRGAGDMQNFQLCSICSVVELPEGKEIHGFRDALASEYHKGVSFVDNLYSSDRRKNHYLTKNSDSFVQITGEMPARAVIFYTEGRVNGRDVLGIVAMNITDFYSSVNDNGINNLCQVYLS